MLSGLAEEVAFVEAATADGVVDALAGNPGIDIVLLDLVMPGAQGFGLLRRVCDGYPDLPVVMLSASADPAKMRKALDIGAAGFITKTETADVMLSALRLVLAGGIYIPPDMLEPTPAAVRERDVAADKPPAALARLTPRQREVLACLGEGKSNKHIARDLDLSENTVKIHVAAILRVLGVGNRTQAAVVARESGIVADASDPPGS